MIASVPRLIQLLYPMRIWKVSAEEKCIYLSFDDGPIPEVTPWVLEQLKSYNAEATFFCIGDNIRKHPEVFRQTISAGHSIGNHTYNHLNGWKTSTSEYIRNSLKTQELIEQFLPEERAVKNPLFRPPYGRIRTKQAKQLQEKGFRIVMWNVLSMDYDKAVSPEKCFRNVIDHASAGSIVVFHDSLKAEQNLRVVLPQVLEHFSREGYSFKSLS